ncbi:MAG TPA: response regulator transcription factor [Bacteroidetes bacterium]|nr:response regulator transcription factor [Bacteroidota bacterium]HIL56797.1 response regulator transcription factor [Rhodothermales bacterium]
MSDPSPLRVLVVDDEVNAREWMRDLLADEPDLEVVGEAATGRRAVAAIREHRQAGEPIDLVLLDVQMPGLTGLDVVREIGPEQMPATVFVTAYDHHALAAFDAEAVDYLLKPFDVERLRRALDRARRAVRLREIDAFRDRLASLIGGGRAEPEQERAAYQERFAVESRGQTKVVPVAAVDYVTSDGPYAELHVEDETFVIRETMQALEARLDPDRFVRIHRSTIVQLDRIDALLTSSGGDYSVRLTTGARLSLSRARREVVMQRLGLAPDA